MVSVIGCKEADSMDDVVNGNGKGKMLYRVTHHDLGVISTLLKTSELTSCYLDQREAMV